MEHVSVREYSDRPVEPETLDLPLRVAVRAPSAGNLRNYSLVVIDDREKMERLAADSGEAFVAKAPLCVVALVDHYRFGRLCRLNDAPFPFDTADAMFIGMWDAVVALHNMAVAAESLGLGTCYIGFILKADNREILGLPDHVFAAGMMSLGYPRKKPEPRSRLPLEAVVHRNTYKLPTDQEIAGFYREWMAKWDRFYASRTEEEKTRWRDELGVLNNAQYITKTVYTRDRLKEWGEMISRNIRRAGYSV
jgi:nitroreductase